MTYQFCPLCGENYQEASTQKGKFHCFACGYDFYISPKPCNGLILENNKGEILLVKRKFDPGKGKWDVPGGFVDQNENLEQSAMREAQEELGVAITNIRYLTSYHDLYEFQKVTSPTLIFMLTATIKSGELSAQDDAEEFRFFPKDQLPWDNLAFNFLDRALRDYLGDK